MEQVKNAIKALEQSVIKLETAVHASKKNKGQAQEQVLELKRTIRTTYDRLDRALAEFKKGTP